MKLSLVIPCYNEAGNILPLLDKCKHFSSSEIEIILINNGSTDNTESEILNHIHKYPCCKSFSIANNVGYGHGILTGLRKASGDIIGWTHADLQTDPTDILKALPLMKDKNDIFLKGRRYGRPFMDVLFTFGMSCFETFLLKKILYDINAQPTLFSRNFLELWKNPPEDFSLDLYAYYLAKVHGLNIIRIPVLFGKRNYGESKWNTGLTARVKFIKRTISFSLKLRSLV